MRKTRVEVDELKIEGEFKNVCWEAKMIITTVLQKLTDHAKKNQI